MERSKLFSPFTYGDALSSSSGMCTLCRRTTSLTVLKKNYLGFLLVDSLIYVIELYETIPVLGRVYGPILFYMDVASFWCCLFYNKALFFDVVIALN